MFWYRLIFFIGAMTIAYFISVTALSLAKKLEHTNRFAFFMKALIVIHYFSAIASLFVGFFMYFREKETEALKEKIADLENQLRDTSANDEQDSSEETYHYMEAANGMTVRVPESKLEEWIARQDAIRNGTDSPEQSEFKRRLVESIVNDLYRDSDEE